MTDAWIEDFIQEAFPFSSATDNTEANGEYLATDGTPEDDRYPTEASDQALLDQEVLQEIRAHISSTIRPSGLSRPPSNFGEPSHGKLTAAQWQSAVEFDITVSLIQLFYMHSEHSQMTKRRRNIARSTMLLALAIRWGTSRRTSDHHAHRYQAYMFEYLTSIRHLFPETKLHPNHHNALHYPDFLPRFGPSHGWWTFPYERIIGLLQRISTNHKVGKYAHLPSLILT